MPTAAQPNPAPGGWHAGLPSRSARPQLRDDLDVDVAIVGAGFSGLWTAHHLLERDPALSIALLEREVVGFGASGRNGGWLMAAPPADLRVWQRRFGVEAVRRAQGILIDAVGDAAEEIERLGIDARVRLAGSLVLARSEAEVRRLEARRESQLAAGWPAAQLQWRGGDAVAEQVGAVGVHRALEVVPCGTLDPARLVLGLAERLEERGVMIFERSGVHAIAAGQLRTEHAAVRAERIVVATEAFTVQLPGEGRRYLPLASTIVSTEPIPSPLRDQLGWRGGEAVGDARHLFFYAQLTQDHRLVLGGRGAPYRLGSAIEAAGHADAATTSRLVSTISEVWPLLADHPIAERWSGSLAVPRDWCASCGLDPATGIAWIGGYAGHGVAASYVLARSLAPLLCGAPDPLGSVPWTAYRPRRWEPEPLRWLAAQSIVRILGAADRKESAGGQSRAAGLVHRFTGS